MSREKAWVPGYRCGSSTGMVYCDFSKHFTRVAPGLPGILMVLTNSHTIIPFFVIALDVFWYVDKRPHYHVRMTEGILLGISGLVWYTIVPVRRKILCEASTVCMIITQVGLPCAKCASKCGCHPSYFYGSILTMQLQRLTFFFRSGCLLMFGHLTREISGHSGHDTNCQSLAFQTVWCQFLSNQKELFV